MGRIGNGLVALAATACVAGVAAPSAAAAASCSFSASTGVLEVDATERTQVRSDPAGRIAVSEYRLVFPGRPPGYGFVEIGCADADAPGTTATPTVATTDSINVRAPELAIDPLGPGRTVSGEGGTPEIETAFSGTLVLLGATQGADVVVLGIDVEAGGIGGNLNSVAESGGDADTDVVAPNATRIDVAAGSGDDTVTGAGGGPLESPLPETVATNLYGDNGTDVLTAGLGPARLDAGFGPTADQVYGGPANDDLYVSAGDGDVIGGAGTDSLNFPPIGGATVDLRVSGPQATGQGTKTIGGIENVRGTMDADVLIGDAGPNELHGLLEDDAIEGGPGDDLIEAGIGRTVLSGGIGDDLIEGSFGRDRISGGPGDDVLRGGAAVDSLFGDAGADLLLAHDRKPFEGKLRGDKRIDCGPGGGPHERARVDEADPEPRSC